VKGRDANLQVQFVLSLVWLYRAMASAMFSAACASVAAAQIDSDTQANIRWDNTLKYSAAWRVHECSGTLIGRLPQAVAHQPAIHELLR
jgi:hypothetical protein